MVILSILYIHTIVHYMSARHIPQSLGLFDGSLQDMTQGLQAGPFGTPDRFATTSQAVLLQRAVQALETRHA